MNVRARLAAAAAALALAAPGLRPGTAAAQAVDAAAPPASFPTTAPETGPAPAVTLPSPTTRRLPNGLTVRYVADPGLPIVQAVLVTRGGRTDAPVDAPELAEFTADLLDEGAAGMDALELAAAIEALGASLSVGAGWDAVETRLRVLKPRLAEALALMSDVVVRPDFPAAEIERKREERLTDLARGLDEPRVIASNALRRLVYGAGHPYGALETSGVTAALQRDDFVDFHARCYVPNRATLILVGDVDPAADHALVEAAFGDWEAGKLETAPIPERPETAGGGPTIVLIDEPGAPQSEIRIGHPGASRDDPAYFTLQVMNTILGGSFTSRLNSNLREEHGYTYGAGSGYSFLRGPGPFVAASAVKAEQTDSALIQFFLELERIRAEPVPPDELERGRNYVALGFPRRFETTAGVAGQLAELEPYGLGVGHLERFVPEVLSVTAADVRRAARSHVRPDEAVVVVVGDRETVEEPLRALDLGEVTIREADEFVH